MEEIHILGYIGALAIGLVQGLIGSGGSLMAVPIFVYVFHLSPLATTAYSLFVVGTSAFIGTFRNLKMGLIDLRLALIFGIPAFISIYVVRWYIMPILPEHLMLFEIVPIARDKAIMVLFALLLLTAAIAMIYTPTVKNNTSTKYNYVLLFLEGMVVGAITGIVGIGGGFLIIPALVFLLKIPMKEAVATSLFIIAFKSLIGFLGDMGHLDINWLFFAQFYAPINFWDIIGNLPFILY